MFLRSDCLLHYKTLNNRQRQNCSLIETIQIRSSHTNTPSNKAITSIIPIHMHQRSSSFLALKQKGRLIYHTNLEDRRKIHSLYIYNNTE